MDILIDKSVHINFTIFLVKQYGTQHQLNKKGFT